MTQLSGITIGTNCYIGNQGSIRPAIVTAIHRNRVTVQWKNSVREMTRVVGVCYEPDRWIAMPAGTSGTMLPRFVCNHTQQSRLDAAPRIKEVVTLLCPQATPARREASTF